MKEIKQRDKPCKNHRQVFKTPEVEVKYQDGKPTGMKILHTGLNWCGKCWWYIPKPNRY